MNNVDFYTQIVHEKQENYYDRKIKRIQHYLHWAVVEDELAERSFPITEVRSSNQVIGTIL